MNLVYLYSSSTRLTKFIVNSRKCSALEARESASQSLLGDAYLEKNDLQNAEEKYLAATRWQARQRRGVVWSRADLASER
jgi:hypothetical protein